MVTKIQSSKIKFKPSSHKFNILTFFLESHWAKKKWTFFVHFHIPWREIIKYNFVKTK